jgi:hypothetical protein
MLCAPGLAWAGAWTLEEGTGQLITTATFSVANEGFDGSRDTTSIPRYRKFELEPLLEYGLTNRFTLMFGPGFQHIDIAPPIDASRSGFGYMEIGGRYRIWQDNSWVFSAQTLLRVPGTAQSSNPAAIGYTDTEVDMRALLGKSFSIGGFPAFIDLQAAQRFRAGDPPSEFRFDATFGIRPAPQWLLMLQSLNVISEGAGSSILFPAYDYEKLQLSVVYNFTPAWALQVGGFTTYSGRNALQENGVITAVWYRF